MRFKAIYVAIIGLIVLGALGYFWHTKYNQPLKLQIAEVTAEVEDYKEAIAQLPLYESQRKEAQAKLAVVQREFIKLRAAKFPPISAGEPQIAALGLRYESMYGLPKAFDDWQTRLKNTALVTFPTSVTLGGVTGSGPVNMAPATLTSELVEIKMRGGGGSTAGGGMAMPGMAGPMPGGMGMPGMGGAAAGGANSVSIAGNVLTVHGVYRDAMRTFASAADKFDRLITFDRISISAEGADMDKIMGLLAGYTELPRKTSRVTVTVPEATIYYLVEGTSAGGGAPAASGAAPAMGPGLPMSGGMPSLMPGASGNMGGAAPGAAGPMPGPAPGAASSGGDDE